MKVGTRLFGLASLVCLSALVGCGTVNFGSLQETSDPTVDDTGGVPPFAVFSVAPSENWGSDFQALIENWDQEVVSDKDIERILAAVDPQRSSAVFVYLTQGGAEPVIYLPVEDYNLFLGHLNTRFKVRKAAASSFQMGTRKYLVKQVGDYAIIGTSLNLINASPKTPDHFLGDLPERYDFALKVLAKNFPKKEKNRLACTIRDSFSKSLADLIYDSESFEFGLNVGSENELAFQAAFNPIPENYDDLQKLADDLLANYKLNASTEVQNDNLVLNIEFPSDDLNSNWQQVEPGLLSAVKSQQSMFAQHAIGRNNSAFAKIREGTNSSLSSDIYGGGSGGGAKPQARRGGG